MNAIEILGKTVKRLDGGYTAGRTGRVFEVDEKRGRVRVEWNGSPRTWVRLASVVVVESEPTWLPFNGSDRDGKRITGIRYVTGHDGSTSAIYRRE